MKKIELIGNNLPILNWAEDIEAEALNQAVNLANHPCAVDHVCIMPDGHAGMGMCIGGVLAVDNAVIPNAVGVDIGCSMSALKTNLTIDDIPTEVLRKIVGGTKGYPGGIRANIPTGLSHNKTKQDHAIFARRDLWDETIICKAQLESAQYQLGSLGGGNHFIEIQADQDNNIWVMIHSGSRNLGYKVGEYYNNLAKELCTKWRQHEVVVNNLAFFPRGTSEYDLYLTEMYLCTEFAKANHDIMLDKIIGIIKHLVPKFDVLDRYYTRHNYATLEHHLNRNLMIHRKGAINANEGVIAIIPGSQGTSSYIVEGLGNAASYCSASHGAGRKMSRKMAKANLSLKNEQAKMVGIVHNITSNEQLDEAPSAYKDIDDVIKAEADLVKPLYKLRPLAVVKG